MGGGQIMDNVQVRVKDGKLTLEIDLSKEGVESKSGKTMLIGCSRGEAEVSQGVYLNLSVYRKKGKGGN
jgi:hypothetical protein